MRAPHRVTAWSLGSLGTGGAFRPGTPGYGQAPYACSAGAKCPATAPESQHHGGPERFLSPAAALGCLQPGLRAPVPRAPAPSPLRHHQSPPSPERAVASSRASLRSLDGFPGRVPSSLHERRQGGFRPRPRSRRSAHPRSAHVSVPARSDFAPHLSKPYPAQGRPVDIARDGGLKILTTPASRRNWKSPAVMLGPRKTHPPVSP